MSKKKIILILFIFLNHCGFSPVYNSEQKSEFNITISGIAGDNYINSLMNNKLKNKNNKVSENQFNLTISNNYKKTVILKDTKGSPSEYELSLETSVFIEKDEENMKTVLFNEKQIIKNISDPFKLKNYENTIKENFVDSTIRKLKFELINFE